MQQINQSSRTDEIARYVRSTPYRAIHVNSADLCAIFNEALNDMNDDEVLLIARDFINPEALREFISKECSENGYAKEFGEAYVQNILEERSDEEEAKASRYW